MLKKTDPKVLKIHKTVYDVLCNYNINYILDETNILRHCHAKLFVGNERKRKMQLCLLWV